MKYEFKGSSDLEFTGNWFIDAGIMGFVRLMEDVYGFSIRELQELVEKHEKAVYYGLFPFAYIYTELKRKSSSDPVSSDFIDKFKDEILGRDFESEKKIFDFTWNNYVTRATENLWVEDKIKKILPKKKSEVGKVRFGKFKLPEKLRVTAEKIKELELNLTANYEDELKELLGHKNIKYTEDIHKILEIKSQDLSDFNEEFSDSIALYKTRLTEFIALLREFWEKDVIGGGETPDEMDSFYRIPIDNKFYKNFLFFNPSSGYKKQRKGLYDVMTFNITDQKILKMVDKTVNKFLKSYKEAGNTYYAPIASKHLKNFTEHLFIYLLCSDRAFEFFNGIGYILFYSNDIEITYKVNKGLKIKKSRIEDTSLLLSATWQEVIDAVVELKSEWTLENMYFIKYANIDSQTQRIIDVEYIGISRIHSTIILDDTIRESLNRRLQIRQNEYKWLLEELIKNRRLKPFIMDHIILRANKNTRQRNIKSLLYALAVDSQLFSQQGRLVFEDPLKISPRMEETISKIKDSYNEMNRARRNISELIKQSERENILHPLVSIIRRGNKYLFVNTLLKVLTPKKDALKYLNSYLFERILQNDDTWDLYATALITGLLGGI